MDNAAVALLKALSDETRLSIVSMLAREDGYVELIAARLGLAPGTVCYHLKKMEAAGLVRCSRSQFYIIYSLNREVFDRTLGELLLAGADTPAEDPDAAYRRDVISHFFKYGRLVRLPAQQKKQMIVLSEIASRFHPDTDYAEPAVDALLKELCGEACDHCTVRRALISAGLMTRRPTAGKGGDMYRRV